MTGSKLRQIITLGCCALGIVFLASSDSLAQKGKRSTTKKGKSARVLSREERAVSDAAHSKPTARTNVRVTRGETPRLSETRSTTGTGTTSRVPVLTRSGRDPMNMELSFVSPENVERMVASAERTQALPVLPGVKTAKMSSQQIASLLHSEVASHTFGPARNYVKFARIQAVEAKGGELIETVLADGTKETTNVANAGDWIVTNPGGEKYIVPAEKFAKKYEPATELGNGWYKPTGGEQTFVQIKHDMDVQASWGELQHLKKGAYLNVTNLADIYGVAEQEFHATYKLEGIADGVALKELYLGKSPLLKWPVQTYAKFARIQAVEAKGGELIETVLADGTKETTNVANAGDWIVTNPGGEKYIVPAEKFAKKYEPATELGDGWFKPTGGNQSFVQIDADMDIVASWGEVQHLKKGAYLNVTNLADIYGVAEQEFHDTYKLVK